MLTDNKLPTIQDELANIPSTFAEIKMVFVM